MYLFRAMLGLRHDDVLLTDAVFASFDIEVASDRHKVHMSTEKPAISQVGFATLDTRDVRSLSTSGDLTSLISAQINQTKIPLKWKKATHKQERQRSSTQAQ